MEYYLSLDNNKKYSIANIYFVVEPYLEKVFL